MKTKSKLSTRKKTALRRIAALVLVAAIASALGLYNFLPIQTVWSMADVEDVENPKVVERFYDGSLPVTRFALHYLVDGDRTMMLCVAGWHLLEGWDGRSYTSVETWDGAGLYAGMYEYYQDGERMTYLFGKLEDTDISHLFVEIQPYAEEGDICTLVVPEKDIFEKNGTR